MLIRVVIISMLIVLTVAVLVRTAAPSVRPADSDWLQAATAAAGQSLHPRLSSSS